MSLLYAKLCFLIYTEPFLKYFGRNGDEKAVHDCVALLQRIF